MDVREVPLNISDLHQTTFAGISALLLHAPAPAGKLRELIIGALNPPSTPLEDIVNSGKTIPSSLYPIVLVEFEYPFVERVPCERLAAHLTSVKGELDMKYYTYYANELAVRHLARKLRRFYRKHRRLEGRAMDGNVFCFFEAFTDDRFSLLTIAQEPRVGTLAVA